MQRNRSLKSTWPRMSPIGGITTSFTMDVTMAPKEAPRITATARSITLPLMMNALKSLSMFVSPFSREMFALRDYMKSATQLSWGVSVLDSPIRSSIQQPDRYGFRQSRDRKGAVELGAYPVVYLITFACYGGHLHGGISASVDRGHNAPGTPILEVDSARAAFEAGLMDQAPYHLDQIRRDAVLGAIQEVCMHRGWSLLAAHVRSNHVHTVVESKARPEIVMKDFKAYASRGLNRSEE